MFFKPINCQQKVDSSTLRGVKISRDTSKTFMGVGNLRNFRQQMILNIGFDDSEARILVFGENVSRTISLYTTTHNGHNHKQRILFHVDTMVTNYQFIMKQDLSNMI